jgi:hypothetical protein
LRGISIATLTQNLAAAGFKLTGLGAGTAAGDSVRFEQVKILQVVESTITTQATTTNTTFTDTGLSATITPSSSSNKVLVLATAARLGNTTTAVSASATLIRGSTNILGASFGGAYSLGTGANELSPMMLMKLDSPATTSATTYKVQFQTDTTGTAVFNVAGGTAVMILLEVNGL